MVLSLDEMLNSIWFSFLCNNLHVVRPKLKSLLYLYHIDCMFDATSVIQNHPLKAFCPKSIYAD